MFLLLGTIAAFQFNPIFLHVDASDAARGIFHVDEKMSVDGPIGLEYPKWIPGEHGPSGPVFDVVDVHFTQNGHVVDWRHDPLNLYRINVQSGIGSLELKFDYVAPRHNVATRNLARVKWNRLIYLPESKASTMVTPTLTVPTGWSEATALDFNHSGKLETTTAERLIDSPAVIGRYYRRYGIDTPGNPPATLEVFTEKPANLPQEAIDGHKRLYAEAVKFFGTPHFRHYQFLLTFSDEGAGEGLEHNECSEDGKGWDGLTNLVELSDLDAHEFSHSWCGKYRRPEGLANLDYNAPMNDEDLWVYEGFTQFAGLVLSGRSRMWSNEVFAEAVAWNLNEYQSHTGRTWRPIEDTAIFGSLINVDPDAWYSRRRSSDYYGESAMLWLEADGIIRRESGGKKTIDDFCHMFFGGPNRGPEIRPYGRQEVYDALNSVLQFDWKGFLEKRILQIRPNLDDGWLEKAGWRLVIDDRANAYATAVLVGQEKGLWLDSSIGIYVMGAEIRDVQEGSSADRAKLAPGMKLVAVNGLKYTDDAMADAVKAGGEIKLVVDDYDDVRTISVRYPGGLKYAHLVRAATTPDLISPVVAPGE